MHIVRLAAGIGSATALVITSSAVALAAPGAPETAVAPAHPPNSLRAYHDRTIGSVNAANGDTNPYGLAVVPRTLGRLVAGNLLVTDFNDAAGTAGGGTSVVQIDPATGAATTFASGPPVSGPVGVAINPLNDGVWTGDFGSSDGSSSNDLLIDPTGTIKAIFDPATTAHPVSSGEQPTFNGVWGQGVSQIPGQVSFYYGTTGSGAAGTGGGEVWRIDPHPTAAPNGQPVHASYVEVASGLGDNTTAGPSNLPVNPADASGPQGFAYDAASGVLYVSDDANNTIYALPGAATATGPVTAQVLLSGGAVNVPENIAVDPSTGGLLVANAGNNTLIEINRSSGAVNGSRVLDRGAAGALFGLATATRSDGRVDIYYVDDNTNTLHDLVSPARPVVAEQSTGRAEDPSPDGN